MTVSCASSTVGVFSVNFSVKRLTTSFVTVSAFSPSPNSTARKALWTAFLILSGLKSAILPSLFLILPENMCI